MPKPWIATLDGGELALANRLQIHPLGQVYGCSVQMVYNQYVPAVSSELVVEVEVFHEMLQRSLDHLRQEAASLGANGVIGIRIDWKAVDYMIAATAPNYGTSLMMTGLAVIDELAPKGAHYLAASTIDEVFALRKADYIPVGLAVGKSSYYQIAWRQVPKMTGGIFSTWANEEVTELTQGPYIAREIAMHRMSQAALAAGGTGIVGVEVAAEVLPEGSPLVGNMVAICRFLCIGTAIRRNPGPTEHASLAVALDIS